MASRMMGVDPTRVDSAQQFILGTEALDTRSGFEDNTIRYVKAGSAIAAGDALKEDATSALEPHLLIPTSAIQQPVVGIAHVAIASGSFGWVTVKGRVASAKAAGGTAAEARLGSSATAGTLATLTQADSNYTSNDYFELLAVASGVGVIALDANDSNSNQIEVWIAQ